LRIRTIRITEWRHFRNLELALEHSAGLVCVVGANGTGKSHLLELIAACAHKLGLSQGTELPRGDPFVDAHDFSLKFYLAVGVSAAIDEGLAGQPSFKQWDRTLTVTSRRINNQHSERVSAGGLGDSGEAEALATQVINALRNSSAVHFVSLDADRSYPKKNIHTHEIGQIYDIDWEAIEYTRGRSFKSTATLYDEWIKYFLAQENQAGTQLMAANRRAQEAGTEPPSFKDPFLGYKEALKKVLPHVVFAGINSKKRQLLFDTTGLELSFDQLSGGEREIAFLVGQIDRFQLKHGLFLIDEPELHLNADLIRAWVAYLTSTVTSGQIWLATHSLEAVEAAGQQATFILEKNSQTKKVDTLARLDTRPVLSALARAVGTPAFSISQLRFVFIEGEPSVGERERFRNLAGSATDYRFLECGAGTEVTRRVAAIKALSTESEAHIRIGGVVDRDFKTDSESKKLSDDFGVFVLPVHEIENLFICPSVLDRLLDQNGRSDQDAISIIKAASDVRAGSWIFQYAMASQPAKALPGISDAAKNVAKNLRWAQIEADESKSIGSIVSVSQYLADDSVKFSRILEIAAKAYRSRREESTLWKFCEGKQVHATVAITIGFSDPQALSQATFALWSKAPETVPEELLSLRRYFSAL
jgi:hypothetical protein